MLWRTNTLFKGYKTLISTKELHAKQEDYYVILRPLYYVCYIYTYTIH